MQRRWISLALSATVTLLGSNLCLAADKAKTPAAAPAASQATAGPPQAAPKLVDINSASRAELTTLPGIGNAEADRIIKARPYLSKANLVSGNVLPLELYQGLKGRIIAVQKPPPAKPKP